MENIVTVGALSNKKLKSNGIRILKDRTLLAPGYWNGRNYSKEEIIKCFHKTDWTDPDVVSLIADHNDDDNKGRPLTIRDWLGFTSNHSISDEGFIKADLNICDLELGTKLVDGKAPFGVSPFVAGMFDEESQSQVDFVFKNSAIVVEPACKQSYINAYLSDDELNEKLEEIEHSDRIKKRVGMFNSEIKEVGKMEETKSTDVRGKKIESKGLQPIDPKKKKKSKFIELQGGKNNMSEEEKIESTEVEEKKEETTEEVKEEVKESEETKETKETEEVKEVEEEESEEKLLDNIAKMTAKLLSKRKVTPEQSKLQSLEKEISFLKDRIQKLEEVKVSESKMEQSKEKLSANPKTVQRTKLSGEDDFTMCGNGPSLGSREFANQLGY